MKTNKIEIKLLKSKAMCTLKLNKCNPLYYNRKLKLNVIDVQLRKECMNLSVHLYKLNVIIIPSCTCSYKLENSCDFVSALSCVLCY